MDVIAYVDLDVKGVGCTKLNARLKELLGETRALRALRARPAAQRGGLQQPHMLGRKAGMAAASDGERVCAHGTRSRGSWSCAPTSPAARGAPSQRAAGRCGAGHCATPSTRGTATLTAGDSLSSTLGPHCTHVIIRHREQAAFTNALALPKIEAVRPEWLLDSFAAGQQLPVEGYEPWSHAELPGAGHQTICVTGFRVRAGGQPRALLGAARLLWCHGARPHQLPLGAPVQQACRVARACIHATCSWWGRGRHAAAATALGSVPTRHRPRPSLTRVALACC
jgi:hypothetical protein